MTNAVRCMTVSLLACMVIAGRAHGVQRTVEPGDRIRVQAPGWFTNFAAELVTVAGDTLWVRDRQSVIGVPRSAVDAIEFSASRRTRLPEGILVGTVAGAGLGLLFGRVCGGLIGAQPVSADPPFDTSGCEHDVLIGGIFWERWVVRYTGCRTPRTAGWRRCSPGVRATPRPSG